MMGVDQPLAARGVDDIRHGSCGGVIVDRDADELGAGAGQGGDLPDGGRNIGGVGVGHGLDNDGRVGADQHASDVDGHCASPCDVRHRISRVSLSVGVW